MAERQEVPLSIRIAAAAIARQQGLNREEYRQLCQRLLRQTVQTQTHQFDQYFGNSARQTEHNFQRAHIGEPYRNPSQLRPGDMVWSDEGSREFGHAMVVGPNGHLYDQFGHSSPATSGYRHPTWIVHPDQASGVTVRRDVLTPLPSPTPSHGSYARPTPPPTIEPAVLAGNRDRGPERVPSVRLADGSRMPASVLEQTLAALTAENQANPSSTPMPFNEGGYSGDQSNWSLSPPVASIGEGLSPNFSFNGPTADYYANLAGGMSFDPSVPWGNDIGQSPNYGNMSQFNVAPTVGEAMFGGNQLALQNAESQGFGPNGFPDYSGDTLSMVSGQSATDFGLGLPQDFGVYQPPAQSTGGNFGFDPSPNFGSIPSSQMLGYPSASEFSGSSYAFDPSAYTGYSAPTSIGDGGYGSSQYRPGLQGDTTNFGNQPSGNFSGYQPDHTQGVTDLYNTPPATGSEFSLGQDLNADLGSLYGNYDYGASTQSSQALSDWNAATQQYGAGNFGYDANGGIVGPDNQDWSQNASQGQQSWSSNAQGPNTWDQNAQGDPYAGIGHGPTTPGYTPGGLGVTFGADGNPYQITGGGHPGEQVYFNGSPFGMIGGAGGGYVTPYATTNPFGGLAGTINPGLMPRNTGDPYSSGIGDTLIGGLGFGAALGAGGWLSVGDTFNSKPADRLAGFKEWR